MEFECNGIIDTRGYLRTDVLFDFEPRGIQLVYRTEQQELYMTLSRPQAIKLRDQLNEFLEMLINKEEQ